MIDAFRDRIREAARTGASLRTRGGGTKDFYGNAGADDADVLDVAPHAGIVSYEPTELYVTARGGTKLDELERALAGRNQMLAFEPPRFGAGSTVGGAISAGLCGPRRGTAGAARDFVLGAQIVDGNGEMLNFGGRVMKNVAGYDVSRLLCGALGTLGVITEVTLKVLPMPAVELTLRFASDEAGAIRRCNEWAGRPLPISGSLWQDGVLHVRLSGSAAGIGAGREKLGGEPLADAQARALWDSIRDHTHPFFAGDAPPLWRIAVSSTSAPLGLPGGTLLEWNGGLRWLRSTAEPAQVRAAARRAGGHATLFRGEAHLKRAAGAFQPLTPALAALHRRVKHAFDPKRVLNRGRLYPDL